MAATPIAAVQLSETPVTTPPGVPMDAANGNSAQNSGGTVFRFVNTDTAQHTVNFAIPGLVDGQAVTPKPVVVPASGDVSVSGFSPSVYGSVVKFSCSSALVKVAVIEP